MDIQLANRFIELRKEHGLSQEQLADQLSVSRQAVSKWERGESSPDTMNLIALAKLYGVSVDSLLNYQPATEPAPEPEEDSEPEYEGEAEPPQPPRAKKMNLYAFPYPLIVTTVFCALGAFYDMWDPAWILFLTIPIYYTAIEGDHFNMAKVPIPLPIVVIYFSLGFAWDWWHPGWVMFMLIPLYYTLRSRYPEACDQLMDILHAVAAYGLFTMFVGRTSATLLTLAAVVVCAVYLIARYRTALGKR